ncbi:recombinase family protein [Streptococcus constellatus subsp. viborgensis]|uniref:recombinase family protein n=1 Tax=Streptococcus constellatus TaxID=76860 RepID=UPI0018E0F192|nr:recombinase family protein [Streptococcus constellatus]QQC23042.1 recombinase family protein [Streptococcus constellatus]
MARTKRRYEIPVTEEKGEKNPTFYQAGIYTRLSQERKEEYRDKSNSLVMQEEICIREAKEKGISIVKVYQDYEYTGTNFKRPAFHEMMSDIKERKINCILVKDLSRFGREYLEIGNYIEKVFPFLGIRFISVNDHFDTENKTDDKKSFEITIKNIINDLYAKDISQKVSSTKQAKMKQGYFIGTFAPYGYKAVRKDKGKVLIVDEKVREVLELIFDLTYKGASQIEIARELTKKYTTPWQYMKTGEVLRSSDNKKQWSPSAIGQFFRNEVYIGNMVQGMHEKKSVRKEKGAYKPLEEWIRVEHTHEAIIDEGKFFEIQNLRKEKRDIAREKHNLYTKTKTIDNKYKGLLICKECGQLLKSRHMNTSNDHAGIENKEQYYFFCRGEDYLFENEVHCKIWESEIDKILFHTVKEIVGILSSKDDLKNRLKYFYKCQLKDMEIKLKILQSKKEDKLLELQKKYEEYVKGEFLLDRYQKEKTIIQNQIYSLDKEIRIYFDRHKKVKQKRTELERFINSIFDMKMKDMDSIDEEFIHKIIDSIQISKNREVIIHFKFDISKEIEVLGGLNYE